MCYQWECSLNRSTCTKNSTDVGRETNPGEVQWCPASRSGPSFDAVKMQRPFSSYCNPVHPRPPKSPMLWWDSSRWSTIIFDFIFNGRDFLCTLSVHELLLFFSCNADQIVSQVPTPLFSFWMRLTQLVHVKAASCQKSNVKKKYLPHHIKKKHITQSTGHFLMFCLF